MISWNRRSVLQGIGAVLASTALLDGAQAQSVPKRKIGYAVVGLGGYATGQIMPQFKNCEHARLVALVSGTPEKLERYGAEYGIPKTHRYSYAEYDRIRDNPDIDVVYVVLPNAMHAEYAIRASQAGKHVMCEKPMATTAAEAEAMIAAAKKAGRKLMIGYRCHFEQHNRRAIELVKTGFVGRPTLITAEHGFFAQGGQWRLDKRMSGGGSLMDIGIYSLNAARYLSGEEPVELVATEWTDRSDPRFKNVEDRIDFQLKFPSGLIANCVSSYSSNHNGFRASGTKGWVGLEPATSYEGHKMWTNHEGKTEQVTLPVPRKNQFVGQLDHLCESILTGIPLRASGEEGLRDMRLIEAIYRSARERRAVSVA
ncbi:Gfo/Idh/MocA family protein [Sphingomonas sp. ac-8]|uniref:Gfo/Idh/MocA family protein n=1 Tax=Sphingomonas sp. ac-8 TaxID=3242977 RepID=UPI003A7FEA2F